MPTPEESLVSRLQTDPTVSALVGDRIYPVNQVDSANFPLIVYQRISTVPFPVLVGTTEIQSARIQISAWAKTYSETKTLSTAIKSVLDGNSKTVLSNEADRFDEDVDINYAVLDFIVWNN